MQINIYLYRYRRSKDQILELLKKLKPRHGRIIYMCTQREREIYIYIYIYKNTGKKRTEIEEEEKIRKQLKPDFSSYFNYLKLAKESGNFAQFFKTYEELHADTELYVENKFNMNLKVFLEEYNSAQFNEEYRKLVYAISMEKYAPIHETENIDELYNNILSIYTEITK